MEEKKKTVMDYPKFIISSFNKDKEFEDKVKDAINKSIEKELIKEKE